MRITFPTPGKLLCLFICLAALICTGCYSELHVKPYAESAKPRYVMVCGELKYNGNKRYLPATVGSCQPDAGNYTIEFVHEQDYTGTKPEHEALLSLMPGTMFGVPTGKDKVLAYAQLKVSRNGREVAKYLAGCMKENYRSLYSGGVDNSIGREQCLDALKINLEAQMLRDEEFWKQDRAR